MAKRLVVIAVLTCIVTALAAQSPPPPSPTKSNQEKQDIGGVANRQSQNAASPAPTPTAALTEASPKPTEGNTTSKSERNSHIPSSEWNWSAINTCAVTVFTFVLMLVGVLQWLSMSKQADYMRRGLPVSIKAARSARFSAIAAQNAVRLAERNTAITERAIVLLDEVSAQPMHDEPQHLKRNSIIVFTLKNFGDTAAHAVKLTGHIWWPTGRMDVHDRPESTIPPQGTGKWITWSLGTQISEQEIRRWSDVPEINLHYEIEVTYTDVFDKTRTHTYKANGQYIPALREFVVITSTTD